MGFFILFIYQVIAGFDSGYSDLATTFLKQCFVSQKDICYLLNYYDQDNIDRSNPELMEYLTQKGQKVLLSQFFKDI